MLSTLKPSLFFMAPAYLPFSDLNGKMKILENQIEHLQRLVESQSRKIVELEQRLTQKEENVENMDSSVVVESDPRDQQNIVENVNSREQDNTVLDYDLNFVDPHEIGDDMSSNSRNYHSQTHSQSQSEQSQEFNFQL